MAKQKNITGETASGDVTGTLPEAVPDTATANTPERDKTVSLQKEGKKPSPEEADDFVLGVLQSFPMHESLYVDRQGGAFTSDTPAPIRGRAILYKNPFYTH